MTKPLSIGIITNSYPPNKNGVAVAVSNLVQCLRAKGCRVSVVTPKVPYHKYPPYVCAVRSTPLPKNKTQDLRFPVNLLSHAQAFFKKNQVDIIHTHDTMVGGLEGILVGISMRVPVVHTYHTLYEQYEYFSVLGYKQFIRSFSQIVCDSSSAVVTLSPKIETYVRSIGVTQQSFRLANPIIHDFFKQKTHSSYVKKVDQFISTLPKQTSQSKPLTLISFGRIAQEKNILATLKIIQKLHDNDIAIRLIIAGDGPYMQQLHDYIIEHDMHSYVHVFGEYEFEHIRLLASYCDAFICTSYSEVLPTTPLEAMMCGLAVCVVQDSAYQYLVKDGVNGMFGDEEILFQSLLSITQKQLHEWGQQAYRDAIEYISQDFGQGYIHMYTEVIHKYNSSPNKKTENPFVNSLFLSQHYATKIYNTIVNSFTNPRL